MDVTLTCTKITSSSVSMVAMKSNSNDKNILRFIILNVFNITI